MARSVCFSLLRRSSLLQLRSLKSFPNRFFSSAPANVVAVGSEADFATSLQKAQGGAPTVFYFTATWCGPCRTISPLVEDLSMKYPHVVTYKVDIDMDGIGNKLSELNIAAVPTLHFFHSGKKAGEVVGADATKLKETMENLYKLE